MSRLALTVVVSVALALPAHAEAPAKGHMTSGYPEYHPADPAAPPVTESNLVASERFWPYQTALTRPWKSLPSGSLGVLVRVESAERARIDFGRDGLHRVPVGSTDLVERANEIRLGRAEKLAPNFLMAIGARLLDPSSVIARAFPFEDASKHQTFLCVFADPWRRDFSQLVTALEPLRARPGVLTILFPQSHRPDVQVSGQLRAMKWTPPYVYMHLSEPYTHTLLGSDVGLPAVLLQTGDGRVLYEGRFDSGVPPKLLDALKRG